MWRMHRGEAPPPKKPRASKGGGDIPGSVSLWSRSREERMVMGMRMAMGTKGREMERWGGGEGH